MFQLAACAQIDEPSPRSDASRPSRDGLSSAEDALAVREDASTIDTPNAQIDAPISLSDSGETSIDAPDLSIDARVLDAGVTVPVDVPSLPGCTSFQDRTTTLTLDPSPGVAPNRVIAHVRGPDGWTNITTRLQSSGRTLDGAWGGVMPIAGGYHWQFIFDPSYVGTYCAEVRSDPTSTLRWRGVVRIEGRDPMPVTDSGVAPPACSNGCYLNSSNRATDAPSSRCAADGEYRAGTEMDAMPTCWRCRAATRAGSTMAAGWIGGGRYTVCDGSVESTPMDNPNDFFLPWTGGISRNVPQGPNGGFSHGGLQAWDFSGGGADTFVRATAAGTVRYARFSSNTGCGTMACVNDANYVVLDHTINGTSVQSLYYHLAYAATPPVAVGARVARGQIIGTIGSTGWSTHPHLHFHFQRACGSVWCNSSTVDYRTLNPAGFRDVGTISVSNTYTSGNSR